MACGAVLAYLLLGRSGDTTAAEFAAFWWVAVVIVVRSDLERLIIPDWASLAIGALGMLRILSVSEPLGLHITAIAVSRASLNGAAAFGLFWLVREFYRRARGREGIGFGDVKLAGACAIWLEPKDASFALELAALAAIAVVLTSRRAERLQNLAMPFGAFMAPAAWLTFVVGPSLREISEAYL